MILYHGSNVVVEQPRILQSERLLDFGMGFYTTSNKEQAIRWAGRVAERRETKDQLLSVYDFDLETAQRELAIVRFEAPDEAWLDFVCLNRRGGEPQKPYDIAIGPVADDDVYGTVLLYEQGILDSESALKRLKVRVLFDQILFHTEAALKYCRYLQHEKIGGAV